MTIPIPDYTAPFKPLPNVTPFTIRDGDTMLKKVEYINKYIRRTLIPWIEENYELLGDAFETQVNILIQQVNDAIELVISDAVEIQDPIVADIINTIGSETRVALDALYATDGDLAGAVSTVNAAIDAVEADVATLETLVNSGRLSQAFLDGRYEPLDSAYTKAEADGRFEPLDSAYTKVESDARYAVIAVAPPTKHAVFIGSSNSADGYGWTGALSTRLGVTKHNYAIGGGAFVPPADPSSFKTQINTAIADNSFPKANVDYVFITDVSNDIRGNNDVGSAAVEVIGLAGAAYPNARIIIVPVVWTYAPDNYSTIQKRTGVSKRYRELVTAGIGLRTRVEVIPNTWLWFWDAGNWLEGIVPNFHLNSAGYDRLSYYIERYLKGQDIDNPIPFTDATPVISVAIAGTNGLRSARTKGIATLSGSMATYTGVAIDDQLAKLPIGIGPVDTVAVTMVGSDRNDYAVYINYDGTIQAVDAIPGGITLWVNASWQVL